MNAPQIRVHIDSSRIRTEKVGNSSPPDDFKHMHLFSIDLGFRSNSEP